MLDELLRQGAIRVWYRVASPAEYRAYVHHRQDTMVRRARIIGNLMVARSQNVEGDVVECGCWQGGMSAAMAEALPGLARSSSTASKDSPKRPNVTENERRPSLGDGRPAHSVYGRERRQRCGGREHRLHDPAWLVRGHGPEYAAERPTDRRAKARRRLVRLHHGVP